VGYGQPDQRVGEARRSKGSIIAANGDQVIDPEARKGVRYTVNPLRRLGRIDARCAQNRAPIKVNTLDIGDTELDGMLGIPLAQPTEPVKTPEYPQATIARLDGRCRNHGVDTGGGTSANEDR
jgi:hypothetical protein